MKNSPGACRSVFEPESRKDQDMKDDYTFRVDNKFIVRAWNSGMEKLCRRTADDIIGSRLNNIFPLLEGEISPVFNGSRKRSVRNFKNTCFMGTNLTADVRLLPFRDKKRKIVEVSVSLNNIRGECPLDRQLADSEKMVAIGKMASSLAHGVRNPLNAIKGAVVYLREKFGHEATLLEFSTIINEEIDRLDGFISGFLSTAKGDMNFAPVNLVDILRSITVMIRPRTEIQDVEILNDLSALPLVSADAFQIEQSLFNIINNALEAMPDGGKLGLKTFLKWEKNIDYAVIEISDTGKGISEKKLKKLGQLSDVSENNDRGFGIFLSREVIKSHNGRLQWESGRERGTVFRVFLPVRHDEQKG